jgi:RHS repeat-associated protein
MSASALASSLAITAESSGSAHADSVPQGVTIVPENRPSWQPAPPVADDELWTPAQAQFSGRWQYGGPTPIPNAALPAAAAGVTALVGEVRRLNGAPMAKVTLAIGDRTATTSQDGTFLIENVAEGEQVLTIDGSTASQGNARYGIYDARVTLTYGQTNELPYVIWMPKLDPRGTVRIPSPTTQETVITNPAIPGLELRIPAGTVIRDRNGGLVTEVNMTAIPVDRPPFPVPDFSVPVYFTIQPGGAVLQALTANAAAGARLIYPNYAQEVPQALAAFWNYDAYGKRWYVYGMGKVSSDALQVIPDPGVAIHEFSGAMINNDPAPPPGPDPCNDMCCGPPDPPPPGGGDGDGDWSKDDDGGNSGCDGGGDPVSLSTGQFTHTERDLWLPDVMPLDIKRSYRSLDLNVRSFGIGMSHPYNMFLWSAQQYQQADLILPSGSRVHYVRTSPGTGWSDAVFGTQAPGQWTGSTIAWNGNGWNLVFRDGRLWRFGENKPMQDMTDRNGNKIIITRRDSGGTAGPITRLDSPNGRWIAFTLSAGGLVTAATDSGGRTFTYAYDASSQLTSVTDTNGGIRTYTWNAAHRLVSIKDPNGNTIVQNVYDANARVTSQTEADGSQFNYAYTTDANGKVTQTDLTDRRGNVRRVNFNGNGFITQNTFPLGKPEQQITTFNVDPTTGWLRSKADALGRTTAYTYDALGNRTAVTLLSGTSNAVTTSFTYTPTNSQVATVTDPLGHVTNFTYDAKGNLTQVIDPNGNARNFTYDPQGKLLSATDALGHMTTLTYSGPDIATATDPLGRTTNMFGDAFGRIVSVQDPLGNLSRANYDSLNRRQSTTDPLGNTVGYTYDANGKLLTFTDPRGGVSTYTYGSQSKPASRKDALNNTETYAYDIAGKLSRVTDRKGQVQGFSYDNLGRRTQIGFGATVANPTSYQTTIGYTYDAGNRVTQIADSANGTITRTYDGLNRLTQEQTPLGTVGYTYDGAGRRTSMTVTGQSTTTYSYDNGNRLTQIARGSETIAFAYDAADRRTQTTLSNGVVVSYGYDNANQLTGITYQKGVTTIGNLTYAYDNAGRRTGVGGTLAQVNIPQAIASALYNANNQLTNWSGQSYTYDLNGNLTNDGARTYAWNARDELTSLAGAATASFQYDGFGRRQSKTVNGTNTQFVYDGLNFVQELASGAPKASLITGLGLDEVFSRTKSGVTSSFVADALGNVIAATDSSGVAATSYSYEPYGVTTQTGVANDNTQQFMATENDGIGLMYYQPRYYIPTCGRFASEDPTDVVGGVGLYAFVGVNRDGAGLYGQGVSAKRFLPPDPDPPYPPHFPGLPERPGRTPSKCSASGPSSTDAGSAPFWIVVGGMFAGAGIGEVGLPIALGGVDIIGSEIIAGGILGAAGGALIAIPISIGVYLYYSQNSQSCTR